MTSEILRRGWDSRLERFLQLCALPVVLAYAALSACFVGIEVAAHARGHLARPAAAEPELPEPVAAERVHRP